jgi:hypothetical protein
MTEFERELEIFRKEEESRQLSAALALQDRLKTLL